MKINEKTKQELIEGVEYLVATFPYRSARYRNDIGLEIVNYILQKLNEDTVSEAEARSERN